MNWLPALIPCDGNWVEVVERAYPIFRADFVNSQPNIAGWTVRIKIAPLIEKRERTFWHLVTTGGNIETQRFPDLERCKRIGWVRSVIDHAGDEGMRRWEQTRGGDENVAISLPDFSYIVFLSKRFPTDGKPYLLLQTAYFVEKEKKRQKYRKECEAYNRQKLQQKPTPL